jgi:signal transduction histidine kinase
VVALSGNVYHYTLLPDAPFENHGPSAAEQQIVRDVKMDERIPNAGEVRVRLSENPVGPGLSNGPVLEIAQKLPGRTWLSARFMGPPLPSPAPDILIAAALGTILTGAAASWLAGRVSRPLSALASAADEVARGRPARLPSRGPDDIRRASEAFNEMSHRVTRTLESHRQLLSAVGHDLRTPLAAMRITAEFVDDEEVRVRLMRNLDELQSMTEAVLSAARAKPGEAQRRVDLAALIESVCDDLVEFGLPVEFEIEGSAPCICRSHEIRRATRNLIENAVRYAGAARVKLTTAPDAYLIIIEDDGPGIPEEQLEQVFEPFVRLEESRNAATGGTGLGLTLTRSIAREHGGEAILENRRQGDRVLGLRATLRLPRERTRELEAAPEVAPEAAAT